MIIFFSFLIHILFGWPCQYNQAEMPLSTPHLSSSTAASITTSTTPIPHTQLQKSNHLNFPISDLPYELRQLVYASHLSLLPPLQVNATALRPIRYPDLIRSPSLFACNLSLPCFYQNATFAFDSVADLVLFARPSQSHHVRSIRIQSYQDRKGGDWVYTSQKCFPSLESIVFEVSEGKELLYDREGWLERVIDALREGRGTKRRDLIVSVERDGGRCISEVL